MVVFETSQEWQQQSSLLLQARPTTVRTYYLRTKDHVDSNGKAQTRITTKYTIPNLDLPKYQKVKKRKREGEFELKDATPPKIPRAVLVLKTFDPESGVCLKFKTDRAAEVGRLVSGLGQLGRHMAALPQKIEGERTHCYAERPLTRIWQDTVMEDTAVAEASNAPDPTPTPKLRETPVDGKAPQAPTGGGGAGKKKKKGKK